MNLQRHPATGVYYDAGASPRLEGDFWTMFVRFDYGTHPDNFSTEEIDVEAHTEHAAREVCKAALERDYEPGGYIQLVEHRVAGVMYL
jgi:hypothetical protein